ncbi:MAG: hypothetical protein WBF53_11525 [Litorimonas sp.]
MTPTDSDLARHDAADRAERKRMRLAPLVAAAGFLIGLTALALLAG